ncbi:MAG: hypothetical protein ABSE82_08335 [Nitrososphaerales archaeon]
MPALFLLIAWGGTTMVFAQQQQPLHTISILAMGADSTTNSTQITCTTTMSVGSAYGATFGSGSYSCGASASFGVSPTIVTNGDVRYVFSGWSCFGAGCYSGSADTSSVTTGGNNSVITETASWSIEYLLTISSNPSGSGSTTPSGSFWENPAASVTVTQSVIQPDWFFVYWSLDGQNAGSSSTFTVTMDSPHSLASNFVSVNITSRMLNVTNSQGVMRNPDGTFYQEDSFKISYHISVTGAALPSNILTNASFTYAGGMRDLVSISNNVAQFAILQNSPYAANNVTVFPYLFNEVGNVKIKAPAAVSSSQPFAVVEYHPLFAYFTYMEYNNLSSSTYARPFVTLVRYDGNAPGYSYPGDANTDPFNAYNSTMERAFINNFTFSTEGWSVLTNQSNPLSSLNAVSYNAHGNLNIGIEMLNKSYPSAITWDQRVWKFYFLANLPSIQSYISHSGIIYFKVTEAAWYSLNATLRYSDFNTSYLYEPVFYNGYLVFSANNIANYNILVAVNNPNPLDPYLFQHVVGIFGNDSNVINAFSPDLYSAYSTMELKPIFANATEEVFLVNQTNIMNSLSAQMPYFTISVSGQMEMITYQYDVNNPPLYLGSAVSTQQVYRNVTYNVEDEYSLFLINDFSPPAPFSNFTGYIVAQPSGGYDLVMQPMSFSFTGPASYLTRTYGYPQGPFFTTEEPGNLTQDYAMLYGDYFGQYVVVEPNFVGGGITNLQVSQEGGASLYMATIQTVGESSITVESNTGQILYNETVASNGPVIVSFNPTEYVGTYTFEFPVYSNGSVSISLNGAWGGINKIVDIPVTSEYTTVLQPSMITQQLADLMWYIFLPVGIIFFFVLAFMNAKKRSSSGSSSPLPWMGG